MFIHAAPLVGTTRSVAIISNDPSRFDRQLRGERLASKPIAEVDGTNFGDPVMLAMALSRTSLPGAFIGAAIFCFHSRRGSLFRTDADADAFRAGFVASSLSPGPARLRPRSRGPGLLWCVFGLALAASANLARERVERFAHSSAGDGGEKQGLLAGRLA